MTIDISTQFDRVNIEIVNTCNLKCSFCPSPEKPKSTMSPEQFYKIAQSLRGRTKEIVLHLLGEPLAHPDLAGILSAAADAGVPINIVTNGMLLTGGRAQLLLRPIVRQVSFSLQSFMDNFHGQNPKTYLERIRAFADDALNLRPDLYLNLRFWDLVSTDDVLNSNGDVDSDFSLEFRQTFAEVFDFSWEDVKIDIRRRKNHRLRGRQYLHFDSRFVWPSMENPVMQSKGFCHGLTKHFGIHADGTVVPCCLDQKAEIALGNVFESSIGAILNSDRAVAMSEGFKKRVLTEELCKRCGFIGRFS